MIVFFLGLILLRADPLEAQEGTLPKPIRLPDVTIQAEDSIYLTPPPAIRPHLLRNIQQDSSRLYYPKPSGAAVASSSLRNINGAPSVQRAAPVIAPADDVRDFQQYWPEELLPLPAQQASGRGSGIMGSIDYIPTHLLDSRLLIETSPGKWRMFTDISAGIAQGRLNPAADSLHLRLSLEGERSFNSLALNLHGEAAGFSIRGGPAGYFISAGKGLSAGGDESGIQEHTFLEAMVQDTGAGTCLEEPAGIISPRDSPFNLAAGVSILHLEYMSGTLYQPEYQSGRQFRLVNGAEQLNLCSEAGWKILNPMDNSGPGLTVCGRYELGLVRPGLLFSTLTAQIDIDFNIIPLEFIISGLWGSPPLSRPQVEPAPLFARTGEFDSGQIYSLKAVCTMKNRNSWASGVKLLIPNGQKGIDFRFLISYEFRSI